MFQVIFERKKGDKLKIKKKLVQDILVMKLCTKFQSCRAIESWLKVNTIEPPSQKNDEVRVILKIKKGGKMRNSKMQKKNCEVCL